MFEITTDFTNQDNIVTGHYPIYMDRENNVGVIDTSEPISVLTEEQKVNEDTTYFLCCDDDNIIYFLTSIDPEDEDEEYLEEYFGNGWGCTTFYYWDIASQKWKVL